MRSDSLVEWFKVYAPPVVVGIIGLLLSAGAYVQLRAMDEQRINEQFTEVATKQSKELQWNLTNYQNALHSAVDLFSSARRVELGAFQRVARVIRDRYPEALALEWLPKVTSNERERFASAMEDQYGRSYTITQPDGEGGVMEAPRRETYYPVTFRMPFVDYSPREDLLGFDHYSLRDRRVAIQLSRDRGSITVTPTTVFPWTGSRERDPHGPDNNLGIIFYKPVFGSLDTTARVGANPEQPVGVIALNLRIQSIISPVFETGDFKHNVAVFERLGNRDQAGRRLIYSNESAEAITEDNRIDAPIAYREQFPVSNGAWTVVIWPDQQYLGSHRSWAPLLALGLGLLLSGIFVQGIYWFSGELLGRREQFRSVVGSAEDAIISTRVGGEIVLWNEAAEKIFGYETSEVVGENLAMLLEPGQREAFREELEKLPEEPTSLFERTVERRGLTRENETFPIEMTFSSWEQQGRTYLTAIIRDVTERKKREEELRSLTEDLEEKVDQRTKELEQFVYAASHDLREPARVMETYAGFLEEDLGDELDDSVRQDLKFIRDSANQMNELIDSLLQLSRIGQDDIHLETVSLEDCVTEALEQQGVREDRDPPEIHRDELPEVTADPSLVRDLYQNLLGNAFKYGRPEDGKLEVRLTAEEREDAWVLGVRDNGPGIDPEFHEDIFEPFQHLDTGAEDSGTGIGLAICRRIVERHGGTIWVESTPGEGTHFRFSLPKTEGPTPL